MIRSMTGFGDASEQHEGVHFAVELRSVNNRYFKPTIRLPDELAALEPKLESILRQRISRGSVTLNVSYKDNSAAAAHEVNEAVLGRYLKYLDQFRRQGDSVDLAALLLLPGVVMTPDVEGLSNRYGPVIDRLVDRACERMLQMRREEGAGLVEDLMRNRAFILERLERIEGRAPDVVRDYHQRLRLRVDALMAEAKLRLDETDLAREVALFAERCDISEEVQRLRAHLDQLERILNPSNSEPAGRTLDFLSQELLREANTIASKSNDALVAQLVVEVKGAIDRIKEQVQNIE